MVNVQSRWSHNGIRGRPPELCYCEFEMRVASLGTLNRVAPNAGFISVHDLRRMCEFLELTQRLNDLPCDKNCIRFGVFLHMPGHINNPVGNRLERGCIVEVDQACVDPASHGKVCLGYLHVAVEVLQALDDVLAC